MLISQVCPISVIKHEDLGRDNVDTESTVLGDCQFLIYVDISSSCDDQQT